MTIALPLEPQEEARLLAVAQARGLPPPDVIVRAALQRVLAEQSEPVPVPAEGRDARPIWEVIPDNMKDVPAEDLAQLPKDGASEIDHYLYGHPKRNQGTRFLPTRFAGSLSQTLRIALMKGGRTSSLCPRRRGVFAPPKKC